MYFCNIKALKEEIKSGDFGDKKAIVYIVVSIALYSIGLELTVLFPLVEDHNIWDGVDSLLSILVPVLGTIYAYRKNGGAEGKDFANKYFSISFVIGIRFLVYFVGLVMLMMFYWSYSYGDIEEIPTTGIDVLIFAIWYVALYY